MALVAASAVCGSASAAAYVGHAKASLQNDSLTVTLSVCDTAPTPIAVEAADSVLKGGKTLAKRVHRWTVTGKSGCRASVKSFTLATPDGSTRVVSVRVRGAAGGWSAPLRLTLHPSMSMG